MFSKTQPLVRGCRGTGWSSRCEWERFWPNLASEFGKASKRRCIEPQQKKAPPAVQVGRARGVPASPFTGAMIRHPRALIRSS